MKNIIIPNPEELKKKIDTIKKDGRKKLHILSDFDRTLTYGVKNGKLAPSLISLLRNGKYLTQDYAPKAHDLFNIYHPIEISHTISKEEKNLKMMEWWRKHFDLLIESGLDKKTIKKATKDMIQDKIVLLRDGAKNFFKELSEKNIPLIILSSSISDLIIEILKQENCLYNNIHIIGNNLEWDEKGKFVRIEKIIHVFNKHESELRNLTIYKELEKRKNVILLGDSMGDLGMVEGFPYKNLIKIAFLNEKEEIEKHLPVFQEHFDVILLEDPDFSYVNSLLKDLI